MTRPTALPLLLALSAAGNSISCRPVSAVTLQDGTFVHLEAEQADIKQGVSTDKESIGSADYGDYVAFQGIDFDAGLSPVERATALANAAQAERDAARFRRLAESGTVDRHRYEQMELASQVAQNQANAAQHGVTSAEKQLAQARLGLERISAREDEVAALVAMRDQAKAALAEAQSVRDDLILKAPAAGVLTTRLVDVGEVIAPGAPMFDIVDLDRLYLKVFIPANEMPLSKAVRVKMITIAAGVAQIVAYL